MTRGAVLAFVLAIAAEVSAAEEKAGATGASLTGAFIQMIAALALIVGVIFLAKYLVAKITGVAAGGSVRTGRIRVVETRYLSPKKSLILVEIAGEYLLLASSGDNLTFIKQIDMLEEIEVVEDLGAPSASGTFQEKLAALLSRREK